MTDVGGFVDPSEYTVRFMFGEESLEEVTHRDSAEMIWSVAGLDLLALHETSAGEAWPYIVSALHNLTENATMLRRFEMFKGDYEATVQFIESLKEGCVSYPDAIVEVLY